MGWGNSFLKKDNIYVCMYWKEMKIIKFNIIWDAQMEVFQNWELTI